MTFQAALPDRLAVTIHTVQLINILCQIYANSTKLHADSSFPFAGGIAYQFTLLSFMPTPPFRLLVVSLTSLAPRCR
jgi:hypothetical protein